MNIYCSHCGCLAGTSNDESMRAQIEALSPPPGHPTFLELLKLLYDWACDRTPKDESEINLMIALWRISGDRTKGCPGCDGSCDEPCAPVTAAAVIAELEALKVRLGARTGTRSFQQYFDVPEGCKLVAHDTGDGWFLHLQDCVTNLRVGDENGLPWPKTWPAWVSAGWLKTMGFEIV